MTTLEATTESPAIERGTNGSGAIAIIVPAIETDAYPTPAGMLYALEMDVDEYRAAFMRPSDNGGYAPEWADDIEEAEYWLLANENHDFMISFTRVTKTLTRREYDIDAQCHAMHMAELADLEATQHDASAAGQ
jgi:hypothetical protein